MAVCHLHDDGVGRVVVFISSRSIEHLLQFRCAGSIFRTVGGCRTATIRSDIEYPLVVLRTSRRGILWTDVERLVVFVCALVYRTVLYAVFTVDVHRDVVGVEGVKIRTLIDTLRGSGLQRVVGVAVGIAEEGFFFFAFFEEGE